jgi:lauroyl/myristoyl acyltransferase
VNQIKPYAYYVGFRVAAFLVRWLPVSLTWPLLQRIAIWAAHRNNEEVRTVRENVSRTSGSSGAELDQLVEKSFVSYALYWHELFLLPKVKTEDVAERVSFQNKEVLDNAYAEGKGVILALPHIGNWELAGAWMKSQNTPIAVVAELLNPKILFDWFTGIRKNAGIDVYPLTANVTAELMSALHANRAIGLLCDRDISNSGIKVNFFGHPTTLPGGPALLAARSGAPIVPTATYLNADRTIHIVFDEPIHVNSEGSLRSKVNEATQLVADRLQLLIAATPEQWHVFQPAWSDQ